MQSGELTCIIDGIKIRTCKITKGVESRLHESANRIAAILAASMRCSSYEQLCMPLRVVDVPKKGDCKCTILQSLEVRPIEEASARGTCDRPKLLEPVIGAWKINNTAIRARPLRR